MLDDFWNEPLEKLRSSSAQFFENAHHSLNDALAQDVQRLKNYSANVAENAKRWIHEMSNKISQNTAVGNVENDFYYNSDFEVHPKATKLTTIFTTSNPTTTTDASKLTAQTLNPETVFLEYWQYIFFFLAIMALLLGFLVGMGIGYLWDWWKAKKIDFETQAEKCNTYGVNELIQKLEQCNDADAGLGSLRSIERTIEAKPKMTV
ncbi:hypothetical protein DdX_11494 [Ditylenchus destructor]|uniref:Uncharacterized protein n=1 Tax=Ditylenchus destructor TaxID=166010 RepID=A0AAD4R164_9BILA|nr:hypothetical protein DdX_11494 [Ditylenchus destructor]